MGDRVERARVLRAEIESMAQSLDDAAAEAVPELFPEWKPAGCEYKEGDRVRAEGVLYKVKQKHISQPDWTPKEAHGLFTRVLPGQDGTDIGEWEQPDSTNGYKKGNRVIYDGKVYESIFDGDNVWSPADYADGWKLIED